MHNRFFLLLAFVGLSACALPAVGPVSEVGRRAVDIAEHYHPSEATVEQLFHVVNYLPRGDSRRAFWFCHAALQSDYPYAETMAVRMGACHRSNSWDCGGSRVTPSDRVKAFGWYSYAATFNPAITAKLIWPLQVHMTVEELAIARIVTGARRSPAEREQILRGFLNCAQYEVTPQ